MSPERLRVPGYGRPEARVLFLAEAPGRVGAGRTGIPSRGDRSGDPVRAPVAEFGFCAGTSSSPTPSGATRLDAGGRNRTPTAAERAACRAHRQAEVAVVGPRMLVPLGETVCRDLTGRPPRECRGRTRPTQYGDVHPLHDPAYVARRSYPLDRCRADWAAALAEAGVPPRRA